MGSKTFVVVGVWEHDHRNVEMATIVMEDHELESINGGVENLSATNIPDELIKEIKKVQKVQVGSTVDEHYTVGLYLVENKSGLNKIVERPKEDHHIGFDLKFICAFDKSGDPK